MLKRFSSHFDRDMLPVRLLRSTNITRLLRYYEPLRLPVWTAQVVMFSHLTLPCFRTASSRVSQVPRLFFRCTPSPFTPKSRMAAHSRSFTIRSGFITLGRLAALVFGVTRPNRVRLRYGLHFCLTRLRQWNYFHLRSFDYICYEIFIW